MGGCRPQAWNRTQAFYSLMHGESTRSNSSTSATQTVPYLLRVVQFIAQWPPVWRPVAVFFSYMDATEVGRGTFVRVVFGGLQQSGNDRVFHD